MKKHSAFAILSVGAVLLLATYAVAGPLGHGNGQNSAEWNGQHMSSFQQVAEAKGHKAMGATGKDRSFQNCWQGMVGEKSSKALSFDQKTNNNWR
jgi:hypothetical protein